MNTRNEIAKSEPKILISTLWIVALFNNTFRDFHEFIRADYMEWLLETTTNGAEGISSSILLGSAIFYQVPISMIFLTQVLYAKAGRWANLIAAPIFIVGIVAGSFVYAVSPDIDDFIFFGVGIATLIVNIGYAWRWSND